MMSTEDTPIIDQLIMKNFGKASKTVRSCDRTSKPM